MKKGESLRCEHCASAAHKSEFDSFNPSIYQDRLSRIVSVYGCEAGLLGIVTGDRHRPAVCAHYGLSARSAAFLTDLPDSRSAFKLAFDSCIPVFFSRVGSASEDEFTELKILQLQNCVSLTSIPLKSAGRCLGVLELFSRQTQLSQHRRFHAMSALGGALSDELWPANGVSLLTSTRHRHDVRLHLDSSRLRDFADRTAATYCIAGQVHATDSTEREESGLGALTPRELDVVDLIRKGHTSKEVSSSLNISVLTVHKHRESIRRKLGLGGGRVNLASFLRQLPH